MEQYIVNVDRFALSSIDLAFELKRHMNIVAASENVKFKMSIIFTIFSAIMQFPTNHIVHQLSCKKVAWPSGLRRRFKAPVSSEAWVRIPPLPNNFFSLLSTSI